MAKPNLQIIQGGALPNSKWLDFPSDVVARSMFDRDQTCRVRIGREDAVKEARLKKDRMSSTCGAASSVSRLECL